MVSDKIQAASDRVTAAHERYVEAKKEAVDALKAFQEMILEATEPDESPETKNSK